MLQSRNRCKVFKGVVICPGGEVINFVGILYVPSWLPTFMITLPPFRVYKKFPLVWDYYVLTSWSVQIIGVRFEDSPVLERNMNVCAWQVPKRKRCDGKMVIFTNSLETLLMMSLKSWVMEWRKEPAPVSSCADSCRTTKYVCFKRKPTTTNKCALW